MIWPIKKKSDGQIASLPPGKIRIKDQCYGCGLLQIPSWDYKLYYLKI